MGENLAFIQGTFYFFTGIWPLIDLPSFEIVTGPKRDRWLVKTIGSLIAFIGAVLIYAAWNKSVSHPTVLLGGGAAAVLGWADIYYSYRGVIPKIYLADAVVEGLFLFLWILIMI